MRCGVIAILLTAAVAVSFNGCREGGAQRAPVAPGMTKGAPEVIEGAPERKEGVHVGTTVFVPRPEAFVPGAEVPESVLEAWGADAFFRLETLSDAVFARMDGVSWKPGCPVEREELRYLRVLYRDASGAAFVGEMVLNQAIAQDALEIFRALFEEGYPIERMRLVDEFGGDDAASMAANNTSAFNYRPKAHNAAELSLHASGRAIDINPLYNPYVRVRANGTLLVEPPEAAPYVDRTVPSPYRITRGDLCHRLFLEHGFRWGGGWASGQDFQHFEK